MTDVETPLTPPSSFMLESAQVQTVPPPPPRWAGQISSTGMYHPDFMFCGACATCHDTDEKLGPQNDKLESCEENDSQETDFVILRTKLRFQTPVTNPSQVLVIKSILMQLPGVSKVIMHPEESHFTVEHDASMSNESVLCALQSVGIPAIIQKSDISPTPGAFSDNFDSEPTSHVGVVQPLWVRSQFYVRGICCASEVPTIKAIMKSLNGVSKNQINITTKMVHVQHDVSIITAHDIARRLSREGFPAQVERDGGIAVLSKPVLMHRRQSALRVDGSITEADIAKIQSSLSVIPGVLRVFVAVSESLIYVDHGVDAVSSDEFVKALQPEFICETLAAADGSMNDSASFVFDHIERSSYVESTIKMDVLDPHQVRMIEKVVAKNFTRSQVRAIYPNSMSNTVKVEHNPTHVSVVDICKSLTTDGLNTAEVIVDGAEEGLYLPELENLAASSVAQKNEPSLFKIHANVWLSGIFWVLSMVSYREGKEWFKYFGLASVLFGLPPICGKALRTLRRCQYDANCMMVTASLGALALGEYDEAASVAFLFAVSEFLEARATMKARKALGAIVCLRPDHANVLHPVSKEVIVVPADRVPLGSLISVRPGDKIAADGVVVDGSTAIDESSLTGESHPAHKMVGDHVSGGTINIGTSSLIIRTTTSVDDSAVARLIRLVEEAQSNRSPTEKMIDTFAKSYTPTVMFLAMLMCTLPWLAGPQIGRYWTLNGLIIVVIACPCALTISTPVTYAAGLAATAQRGIVIKGGANLEAMGSVDRIVFDKTGTLTKGKFSVMQLEVVGTAKSREEMLQLLSLMQSRSSHPLSASLVDAAKKEGIQMPHHIHLTNHNILKGEGITALADGRPVFVGNERLFARLDMIQQLSVNHRQLLNDWSKTGATVGFIGTTEDGIIGMFCVMDVIREEAKMVIQGLKDARIDTMICTGDSHSAAHTVANEIGIPPGAVHSQLLPEDKLHFVGSLKRPHPKRFGICRQKRYIMFCGDGVNDAPALAVADVGVSMGEGAAMAMEMSDVTLMDSNLTKLLYAIEMGRRVLRTVKENIFLSLMAKAVVVAATFAGKMTLLLAIGTDVGIMLIVTLNGMKLLPYYPTVFTAKNANNAAGNFEMTIQSENEGCTFNFEEKDTEIV